MTEEFLTCTGLSKRFGSALAVDSVDLSVTKGELLALLGPSGCGKTTLLRLIAGFETPDEGEIRLGDRLLTSPRRSIPPEKRQVALVFQDFALFPHLNVGSNIAFGLPKGSDKREKVQELLEMVGLQGLEQRMPHQLSGGQQQRVALARALASEPELILLDEPFSNLDPSIRARVRSEVKQLIQSIGITAIFVTHDQEEALSLAEQVGVMIDGQIQQVGAPEEVYTQPANRLVGEFVGGANFLVGVAGDGFVDCELGRLALDAGFIGRAELLIRAENLEVCESEGEPAEVVSIDYYGHDEMVTVRLKSGNLLKVRLMATPSIVEGQQVGVRLKGDALIFPAAGAAAG